MQRLSELRSAALKKMILGYIFVFVALIVEGTGIVLAPMAFYDSVYGVISIVMIILALPFLGVGTPFAIIGTIRLIKANREISLLRMEERKNGGAARTEQSASAPAYTAPSNKPQVGEDDLKALYAAHSGVKKKMVLGIVLMGVAAFLWFIGRVLVATNNYYGTAIVPSIFFTVLSLLYYPGFGVGIPFFIIGLIGVKNSNRKISEAKAEIKAEKQPSMNQPAPEVSYQPAPAQEEANPEPVQETAKPEPEEKPHAEAPKAEPVGNGFVDIDWQKYSPLDAGITYDETRAYEFNRFDGFAGSVPQKFVNRTFPKCPICCNADPYWTITQHNQMSMKGNLYLFKCSHCGGIFSMSMPDVTTLGNGGSGFAANPTVGLTNLMVKASSGKEVGAVYAVIESVGTSGVTRECEGKEFKLEDLQDMFLRM